MTPCGTEKVSNSALCGIAVPSLSSEGSAPSAVKTATTTPSTRAAWGHSPLAEPSSLADYSAMFGSHVFVSTKVVSTVERVHGFWRSLVVPLQMCRVSQN